MSFVPLQPGSFLPALSVTNRNMAADAIDTQNIADNAITTSKIANVAVTDDKIASVSPSKFTYTARLSDIAGLWTLTGSRNVIDQTTGTVSNEAVSTEYTITTSDGGISYQLLPASGTDSATSGYKIVMPTADVDTSGNTITSKFVGSGKVSIVGASPADVQTSIEINVIEWSFNDPVAMIYRRVNTEPFTVGGTASYMVETGFMVLTSI